MVDNIKNKNDGSQSCSDPLEGYLQGGYYVEQDVGDGQKRMVMSPKYIIDYPRAYAAELTKDGQGRKNTSTQVRKFYDYCVQINSILKRQSFQEVAADFSRLVPFADNAKKRDRVTDKFLEFIQSNVQHVHNKEDFIAFFKHFEALIAYLKYK